MFVFQSMADAKMYRWEDEKGRVYYSDKVPPDTSRLERNVLNKNAQIIDTIKAAKTKEQIALEKRLKLLRREQEKIIARQKSNDKVLLSTFRNIDDLRMTLNGKVQSVEAQKRVYQRTLKNYQEDLANVRKKAAKVERAGQKVPEGLLSEMAKIDTKIVEIKNQIASTKDKKVAIQKKFDKDIERFLFLTRGSNISAEALSNETAETKAANTLGLFNCKEKKVCDQAWEVARQFVKQNSTTQINFNTDTLIMGGDPMDASDLSLSASKIKRQDDQISIFLDIRCHVSNLGEELCQSDKVKKIRQSFRPFIDGLLKK